VAIALGGKPSAIINITPLIDVVMVLLIIFMCLPTKTVGLNSELPQPAPESTPATPNPQDLVLVLHSDGSIDVNSQPVVLSQLDKRLRTLFAGRPNGVLFVSASRDLDFADVAAVIYKARGAAVPRIGILTAKNRP